MSNLWDLVSPFSNFGRFIFMLAPGLQLSLLALTIPIWHCMLCAAFFHQTLPNHPLDFDFLVSCMYWPGQGVVFNVWTFWYFCNLSSYKILRNCFEVIISCKESTFRAHGCVSFQTSSSVNVTFNLHETVESVTCCSCFGFFSARFFFFFLLCWVCGVAETGDVQVSTRSSHDPWWRRMGLDSCPLRKRMRMASPGPIKTFFSKRQGFCQNCGEHVLDALLSVKVHISDVSGCATTGVVDMSWRCLCHRVRVIMSSYIVRSCFGLSVCLKFPVERCFFVMSGYTYKTIVHALHGMNKHDGFGGPLWGGSYDDEVQSIMKRLLTDSDNDKSLTFNNFTDPCSELTKKKQQTMRVFDFADKKKKLPFGPLPAADRTFTWLVKYPKQTLWTAVG